jgi:AAA ATPase domain
MLKNPFHLPAFWGRQRELRTIYDSLTSAPPQHCAIIGETNIGKTTLLRALSPLQGTYSLEDSHKFTFVYLDCLSYTELSKLGDSASPLFWRELYNTLLSTLQPHNQPALTTPSLSTDQEPIEAAYATKSELEDLLRKHKRVVIMLDNFEGVACLPLRDSQWLRSLGQFYCTYVVSSRHFLHLLYQYDHAESRLNPSPFWNMFLDPIYLGLMTEQEVGAFLQQAKGKAEEQGSHWTDKDITYIRKMAGRHPELLRSISARLFEQRLNSQSLEDDELLESSVYKASEPICQVLWYGLADPQLRGEPIFDRSQKAIENPSLYQEVVTAITKGQITTEEIMQTFGRDITKDDLYVLKQRGLIENINGKWCIFAEVMRRFILRQERACKATRSVDTNQQILNAEVASGHGMYKPMDNLQTLVHLSPVQVMTEIDTDLVRRKTPSFTRLEGEVYDYLLSNAGKICSKEEIKNAVWMNKPPGDSAVQKIIERIRKKIEEEPDNPRFLIAVRGQGYMLRDGRTEYELSS